MFVVNFVIVLFCSFEEKNIKNERNGIGKFERNLCIPHDGGSKGRTSTFFVFFFSKIHCIFCTAGERKVLPEEGDYGQDELRRFRHRD